MEVVKHGIERSRLRACGAMATFAEARRPGLRAKAGTRGNRRANNRSARSAVSALTLAVALSMASGFSRTAIAQSPLPELTAPVNDFAGVIDAENAAAIDRMIRALKAASGDVVVVATVQNIDGYSSAREYATKLFENRGRGIGDTGKDNGLLILLALQERRVEVEVGYDLEQWVTDGFAGETSRLVMAPHFRTGDYGTGLRAGAARIIARIAQGRGVTLQDVPVPREPEAVTGTPIPFSVVIMIFLAILIVSRIGQRRRRFRHWGRGGWSGWSSGVGPFGGGFGGGFGGRGGGFGGGFGGFGGGRSGGGGGGASW